MGPLRGGLILSLLASPALAGVCDETRPAWDGMPVTALDEALYLFTTPISLFLIAALATAVVFRHAMGAALVALLWGFFITSLILPDGAGTSAAAITEGCAASPALYIALSGAICLSAVIYTARREKRL